MTLQEGLKFFAVYFRQSKEEVKESQPKFLDAIIRALLPSALYEKCVMLNKGDDYLDHFFNDKNRKINQNDAKLIIMNQQVNPCALFFKNRMPKNPDTIDELSEKLTDYGYENDGEEQSISYACVSFFLDLVKDSLKPLHRSKSSQDVLESVKKLEEDVKALPAPRDVPVPPEPIGIENTYLKELYRAYSDDLGSEVNEENIADYPDYSEDIKDRRIDFFAAETIHRGIDELHLSDLAGQFDVLKEETKNNVIDTDKRLLRNRRYSGYECMLGVMEQAVAAPVTNYILSSSPYWISGNIKKGVCHFLVNDKVLRWIRES